MGGCRVCVWKDSTDSYWSRGAKRFQQVGMVASSGGVAWGKFQRAAADWFYPLLERYKTAYVFELGSPNYGSRDSWEYTSPSQIGATWCDNIASFQDKTGQRFWAVSAGYVRNIGSMAVTIGPRGGVRIRPQLLRVWPVDAVVKNLNRDECTTRHAVLANNNTLYALYNVGYVFGLPKDLRLLALPDAWLQQSAGLPCPDARVVPSLAFYETVADFAVFGSTLVVAVVSTGAPESITRSSYVNLYDISDPAAVRFRAAFDFPCTSLSFSPDGLTLAMLGRDIFCGLDVITVVDLDP